MSGMPATEEPPMSEHSEGSNVTVPVTPESRRPLKVHQ
jgi:hypothetical protein